MKVVLRNGFRDLERLSEWRIRGPAARGSQRKMDNIVKGWLRESERLQRHPRTPARLPTAAPLTAWAWTLIGIGLCVVIMLISIAVLVH